MSKHIAIVVLACASPPYDKMLDAIRTTWGAVEVPGVEVFYVYGKPHDDQAEAVLARAMGLDKVPRVEPGEVYRKGRVILAGCADLKQDQEDCLLRKRLIAFEHLLLDDKIDLIYTVCATSYIDQSQLIAATAGLRSNNLFYGPLGVFPDSGTPWISGASMLLSRDLVQRLVDDSATIIKQNQFGWRDDVTLGHWIATQYSGVPLSELVAGYDRRSVSDPEQVFFGAWHQSEDFVITPRENHQPRSGVYHYHFHSHRPGDLVHFHSLCTAPSEAGNQGTHTKSKASKSSA
ncbi:MAG: hypothetical protein HOC23_23985 [Halieaceae bacterium]|jgi:hypothetical protein|nr:hypothetical protein [Halieaceae bacterium]